MRELHTVLDSLRFLDKCRTVKYTLNFQEDAMEKDEPTPKSPEDLAKAILRNADRRQQEKSTGTKR